MTEYWKKETIFDTTSAFFYLIYGKSNQMFKVYSLILRDLLETYFNILDEQNKQLETISHLCRNLTMRVGES